ncbi:MAG: hypothetical protein J6Y94_05530, partial [Bacteriovoracaceae bacterium]|nr:hypothetical protein [Bacteriovoracaceae bacterium]
MRKSTLSICVSLSLICLLALPVTFTQVGSKVRGIAAEEQNNQTDWAAYSQNAFDKAVAEFKEKEQKEAQAKAEAEAQQPELTDKEDLVYILDIPSTETKTDTPVKQE